MTREEIQETLRTGAHIVVFTKVDGTQREMICTLDQDFLPEMEEKDGEKKKERKVNEEVLPVYDLQKKGWRSFRVDSVTEVR